MDVGLHLSVNMWMHEPGSHSRKATQDLPSAVLAIFFIARRIQPSLFLVKREVEFCVPHDIIVLHLLGMM